MSPEAITSVFDQFAGLRVLVIGDVMIDRYLNGSVDRISPEAPVPVILIDQEDNRLGGAANVALNLRALGVSVQLISVIGTDPNGDQFVELLPSHELPTSGLLRSSNRPTTVKTRVIAQNQHLLRADREETCDLPLEEENELWNIIEREVKSGVPDLILFQDYNKGVLTKSLIHKTLQLAHSQGIPTAVDPKKANFWEYKGVTLFKPNLKEVRDSVSNPVDPNLASLQRAAEDIRSQINNQITLITLSEKGLFLDESGSSTIIGTRPRSIADVCGAGDTVISVAAAALAAGVPLPVLAELANLAGGQVCEKVGVVPVDRVALQKEYQELHSS